MSTQINFELVSPEAKLVSEPIHMAVIPGEEGQFGVMAGHASLVASLRAGIVELYKEENGDPKRIFIAGGFADVTSGNCSVLAEEAVNVNDIDTDVVQQSIKTLKHDLELAEEPADKIRLKRQIALAEAKLEAKGA
ncbi:MAG: ATP synthase F1 subunit epsilon [Alphaproteobacteria bacterium]|nr:ATP synthase F1 subunit epsilon [Alphaproteobacteria bacterium]